MSSRELPISFSSFVISLAGSAMMHLGEAPGPAGATQPVNLPLARNTIDVLGLLKEKTEGNLDEEEQKLLETLLYDLRNTFVAKSESGS